jgi:hypothetical protein
LKRTFGLSRLRSLGNVSTSQTRRAATQLLGASAERRAGLFI